MNAPNPQDVAKPAGQSNAFLDGLKPLDLDVPAFFPDADRGREAGLALTEDLSLRRTAAARGFLDLTRVANAAHHLGRLPAAGESVHGIMRGNFDAFDFVPAILDLAAPARLIELNIATLGFNSRNADALLALIDAGRVRRDINALAQHHPIRLLGVDPWNATQLLNDLAADGFEIVKVHQNYRYLSPPSKELERMILSKTLRHHDHPILTWMASNAVIETDAAANIRPSKRKSREKIDGVIALVEAIGASMAVPPDDGPGYTERSAGNVILLS